MNSKSRPDIRPAIIKLNILSGLVDQGEIAKRNLLEMIQEELITLFEDPQAAGVPLDTGPARVDTRKTNKQPETEDPLERLDQDLLAQIVKKDPEIDSAIKIVSKYDVRESKLFFDGHFLYWMINGAPLKKWAATSGKYDRLAVYHWEARLIMNTIKKLQNNEKRDKEDVISDLRLFSDLIPGRIESGAGDEEDIQERVYISRAAAEALYNAWAEEDQKKFFSVFRSLTEKYNISI